MPEDVELPELPPAEVTVQYRPTGAAAYLYVLVTLALAPFVQAVAAAFGTRLAQAIDEGTRHAVRRLLRRAYQPAEEVEVRSPWIRRASVQLRDERTGARITIDDELPAEAVAQLVVLAQVGPVPAGEVFWSPRGDRAGRWYVWSDSRRQSVWDPAARRWEEI